MRKRLIYALLLMGFSSLVVQALLIREFLVSFQGNELVIGIILANWIILEAAGSFFAGRFSKKARSPLTVYALLQAFICAYLPISIFLTREVKNLLFLTPGEGAGITDVFLSSFLIFIPLALSDGAQFPFGCRLYQDYTQRPLKSVGEVYILEAGGFILAGPLFTFLFIRYLNSFQIALTLGLFNLSSGLFLVQREIKPLLKRLAQISLSLLLLCYIILLTFNFSNFFHKLSIQKQWKGCKVLDYRNSIYGNLAVIKQKEQYTFFSDGIPIITTPTPDIIWSEEFIHFGLLSHPHPQEVLLIGGGAGGPILEALKHPLHRLDYAQLDPLLIKLLKKYPTDLTKKELSSPRLNVKIIDGVRFIKKSQSCYDLILLNLPPPTTLQLNRFYTQEFFSSCQRRLKEGGILILSLPGSLSYISDPLGQLNLSILNTLKKNFANIFVIPGDFNLYLASNSPLEINKNIFLKRLKERKIETKLLTPFHIQYRLQKYWRDWFWDSLKTVPQARDNRDLTPCGVFYGLVYWNALFSPSLAKLFRLLEKIKWGYLFGLIFIFGLILFLLQRTFLKTKRVAVGYAIASTGFSGMSLDLMVIFSYQSFFGFVYHHIALLVTSFMVGLSLGGWLMTKRLDKIREDLAYFSKFEMGIMLFCIVIMPLLWFISKNTNPHLSFIFFILAGISGYLVGSEFPLANKIYYSKGSYKTEEDTTQTAGVLYSLDLFGAWVASILVSVALVPVLGIFKTCILLIALKASSLTLVTIKK